MNKSNNIKQMIIRLNYFELTVQLTSIACIWSVCLEERASNNFTPYFSSFLRWKFIFMDFVPFSSITQFDR